MHICSCAVHAVAQHAVTLMVIASCVSIVTVLKQSCRRRVVTSVIYVFVQGYTARGISCWSGNDDEAHAARHEFGASGAISVTSNIIPGLFSSLMATRDDEQMNRCHSKHLLHTRFHLHKQQLHVCVRHPCLNAKLACCPAQIAELGSMAFCGAKPDWHQHSDGNVWSGTARVQAR